ncbi:MAG TPA: SRPBCC family protein [Acidimicrobiales bacterium]|nr:SRPBCC family protein [Acidimicrobiales bacterium]
MPEVNEEAEFTAGIDEVWKVVGDFGGFIEAMGMPVKLEGEGIGQTRTIEMGGAPMVERLEERDEAAKRLVYSIVSGPLPLENYRSTMQLTEAGEATRLSWSGTFTAAEGAGEEDAANIVRSVYQGGIGGLKARFGG